MTNRQRANTTCAFEEMIQKRRRWNCAKRFHIYLSRELTVKHRVEFRNVQRVAMTVKRKRSIARSPKTRDNESDSLHKGHEEREKEQLVQQRQHLLIVLAENAEQRLDLRVRHCESLNFTRVCSAINYVCSALASA